MTLLSKQPRIRKIGIKTKNYMIYNGIIKIVLASIIYFMLGGLLNLRYSSESNALAIINTILSVFAVILIIAFSSFIL